MPAEKKKKSRATSVIIVAVTVIIVVLGIVLLPKGGRKDNIPKGELAKSDTVSETEPLGKFDDFNVTRSSIEYDDNTVAPGTESNDPALPSSTNAARRINPSATRLVEPSSTQIVGPTALADPISTTTTKVSPSGSSAGTTGAGADYAYSYAGFTPKPANMNAKWNLLLVNRNYILPEDYSPELSEAVKGSGVRMDSRVSPHYQAMFDAAQKDGITLTPLSGHRRISTQKTNFENKIKYYESQGKDHIEATKLAATIILPPGTSEHNAGLAMDIISLDVDFEETKAFDWLQKNAQDYGFILRYPKSKESITGITYEPWHWRYVGVEDAKKIKQSGQCLEEYLGVA